jgi:hypothetical protein
MGKKCAHRIFHIWFFHQGKELRDFPYAILFSLTFLWRMKGEWNCLEYSYTEGSKKCTRSLIVNIFGTKWHIVTILAWYCGVMFAHVSRECCAAWALRAIDSSNDGWKVVLWATQSCTMDRSKRCYWVPTTVSRPNTSRLLPMRNLEGWSLSTKASHTECATRNHRSVMCSHHARHTDSRSSLSSSAASTLFSRWWWSLQTHIMTHSLSAQELN